MFGLQEVGKAARLQQGEDALLARLEEAGVYLPGLDRCADAVSRFAGDVDLLRRARLEEVVEDAPRALQQLRRRLVARQAALVVAFALQVEQHVLFAVVLRLWRGTATTTKNGQTTSG